MADTDFAEAFTIAQKINRSPRELCMLCTHYDPAKMPARAGIEIKADGIRLISPPGIMQTREGVPFDAASHLWFGIEELRRRLGGDYVIDGEFVAGTIEETNAAFRRGTAPGAFLTVFDAVPMAAYLGRETSSPLHVRRELLVAAFGDRERLRPAGLVLTDQGVGYDAETAELAAGAAWQHGLEGVVVKDLDSPYVRTKSPFWMKIKRKEIDLVTITGVGWNPDGTVARLVGLLGRDKVTIGTGWKKTATVGDFPAGTVIEVQHLGRTPRGALKSSRFLRKVEK